MFSQALKTIWSRPDGATLEEIKESFREIDLYHHDPLTLLRWQHANRGWGFRMNPYTGRITVWRLGEPNPKPLAPAEAKAAAQSAADDLLLALKKTLGMAPESAQWPVDDRTHVRELAALNASFATSEPAPPDDERGSRFEEQRRREAQGKDGSQSWQLRREWQQQGLLEDNEQRRISAEKRRLQEERDRKEEQQRAQALAEQQHRRFVERRSLTERTQAKARRLQDEITRQEQQRRADAEAEQQRRELKEHQRLLEEIEQRRIDAQAEWRRIEEERRQLDDMRRVLEQQQQRGPRKPTNPEIAPQSEIPDWLLALPEPDRNVFRHLAEHGAVNEEEATRILGGARQFRRFSMQFDSHCTRCPFKVRIEMSGQMKCYVRED